MDRDRLCRRLEGVEHRPLTTGQVHTRGTGLADCLEDFLNQLELVGSKWVVLDEILAVLELAKRHAAVLKGELALEDVAALVEDFLKFAFQVGEFCQQT